MNTAKSHMTLLSAHELDCFPHPYSQNCQQCVLSKSLIYESKKKTKTLLDDIV